jgi:hypothetical protein
MDSNRALSDPKDRCDFIDLESCPISKDHRLALTGGKFRKLGEDVRSFGRRPDVFNDSPSIGNRGLSLHPQRALHAHPHRRLVDVATCVVLVVNPSPVRPQACERLSRNLL